MNCPYCNSQNAYGAIVCSSCGASLVPQQVNSNYQPMQNDQYQQNQMNDVQQTQFIQQNTQAYPQPAYNGQNAYEQQGYQNQQYYNQQDYSQNQPAEYYNPDSFDSNFAAGNVVKSAPMKRSTKIMLIVIGIIIVVLGIGYTVIQQNVYSPQATIQRYVKSLQEGNFDEANNMTDWSSSKIPENYRTLLTSAIGRASKNHMSYMNVDNGPYNSFKLSYKVGDRDASTVVTLVPAGKQWLFFDSYKVQYPPLGHINITVPNEVDKIKVNDSEINLSALKKSPKYSGDTYSSDYGYSEYTSTTEYKLPAYPGSYRVESAKNSQLWTTNSTDVLISGKDSSESASLELEATETLKDELTKAIQKHVDKCVASTEADVPESCRFASFNYYTSYSYDNIKRSVNGTPTLDQVDMSSGTFQSDEIGVDISYRWKDDDDDDSEWRDDHTTNSGYVYGKFSIKNNKLVIDFNQD